ncbi:hypothetical protein AVEN_80992-1, partial [Araneus ventricosus]
MEILSSKGKQTRKKRKSSKIIATSFLGNQRDPSQKSIVEKMLGNFQISGCNTRFKAHFLHSHTEYFHSNLGAVRKEKHFIKAKKRWKDDIKEEGYQHSNRLQMDVEKRRSSAIAPEEKHRRRLHKRERI